MADSETFSQWRFFFLSLDAPHETVVFDHKDFRKRTFLYLYLSMRLCACVFIFHLAVLVYLYFDTPHETVVSDQNKFSQMPSQLFQLAFGDF